MFNYIDLPWQTNFRLGTNMHCANFLIPRSAIDIQCFPNLHTETVVSVVSTISIIITSANNCEPLQSGFITTHLLIFLPMLCHSRTIIVYHCRYDLTTSLCRSHHSFSLSHHSRLHHNHNSYLCHRHHHTSTLFSSSSPQSSIPSPPPPPPAPQ